MWARVTEEQRVCCEVVSPRTIRRDIHKVLQRLPEHYLNENNTERHVNMTQTDMLTRMRGGWLTRTQVDTERATTECLEWKK